MFMLDKQSLLLVQQEQEKTTIVKLLMRFYELNKGSIMIDGHDIKDFSRHDLRSLFGMVLQDTWLFNGTIRKT